ncbi:MAG: tRNA pseudouridine(55) synthase TruB, partial [Firmicutes bacterium]|nr:tRNA pseudouridine(55) synthase TruB [Bacillota bacterium]
MDGILNICKPKGISSFKALSIAKARLAKEQGIASRRLKVGHLGTLDPAAVGVLILLVGKATKLNQKLSADRKTYRSVFSMGITSPTLDCESEIDQTCDFVPTTEQIIEILPQMVGKIEIEVPKFSAVHIGGQRAYDLARKGIDFTPPKKIVQIYKFELLQDTKYLDLHRQEPLKKNEFYFEIECETGTYIRSLAKLLAQKLGTLALASTIIRTKVGHFDIDDSKKLDDVVTLDIKPI